MACEKVGDARPDIAGIGILVAFAVQAFISLALTAWIFLMSNLGHLELKGAETTENKVAKQRLQMISDILLVGNDVQILTGIAYMINGFVMMAWLDLYHLRLMFDVICFVGVSNAVTLVFWSFCAAKLQSPTSRWKSRHGNPTERLSRLSSRYRASYLFAALFVALTIVLCIRLSRWDEAADELGRCYNTDYVTFADASHPQVDIIYVGTTAAWMLCVIGGAVLGRQSRRRLLLILGALQYPVHLYMVIALRIANQNSLEGGESENAWDFGQSTSLLLLGITFAELITKLLGYRQFEKGTKDDGSNGAEEFRVLKTSHEAPAAV